MNKPNVLNFFRKHRSAIFRRRTMKGHKHMKTITNIIYAVLALFSFACHGWGAICESKRASRPIFFPNQMSTLAGVFRLSK